MRFIILSSIMLTCTALPTKMRIDTAICHQGKAYQQSYNLQEDRGALTMPFTNEVTIELILLKTDEAGATVRVAAVHADGAVLQNASITTEWGKRATISWGKNKETPTKNIPESAFVFRLVRDGDQIATDNEAEKKDAPSPHNEENETEHSVEQPNESANEEGASHEKDSAIPSVIDA